MNRLWMLVVTGILALTLTACGDNSSSKQPADDKTTVEEVKGKMDDAAKDADQGAKQGLDAVENKAEEAKDAVTGDDKKTDDQQSTDTKPQE